MRHLPSDDITLSLPLVTMDLPSDCPRSAHTTVSLPPPPRYEEVPGTVPLHAGRNSGPPPSYEDVINPDGESLIACPLPPAA